MDLKIDECPTPLGTMLAVHDAGDALVALVFSDHAAALPAWLQRQGLALASAVTAPVARTRRALDAYFAGDLVALCTLPLHWTGTAFQRACWQALLRIAPGAPISYAEQARAIGRPGAARAVGGANALNPIAIVVPCHRVIGSNAALTGYAGGLARKRWLLAHEAEHCGMSAHRAAA